MVEVAVERPRRAFFSIEEYPELIAVRSAWKAIRDEGRAIRSEMIWVRDRRTVSDVWAFGPLMFEQDARNPARDKLCGRLRAKTPRTLAAVRQVPDLLACGFSLLQAHGRIDEHTHEDPCVTAALCLSEATPCEITVQSETRQFQQGEFTIFDFTLPHGIVNNSPRDRLALLLLLPNKLLEQTQRSPTGSGHRARVRGRKARDL